MTIKKIKKLNWRRRAQEGSIVIVNGNWKRRKQLRRNWMQQLSGKRIKKTKINV